MKLSTIRRGQIGEHLVMADLLRKNMDVYEPLCDDRGIDLLVLRGRKPTTIQVKNHKVRQTNSSLTIKVSATNADIIAVPYEGSVYYVPNKRKNIRWDFSLATKTPLNNQKKKIRFATDYKELPNV